MKLFNLVITMILPVHIFCQYELHDTISVSNPFSFKERVQKRPLNVYFEFGRLALKEEKREYWQKYYDDRLFYFRNDDTISMGLQYKLSDQFRFNNTSFLGAGLNKKVMIGNHIGYTYGIGVEISDFKYHLNSEIIEKIEIDRARLIKKYQPAEYYVIRINEPKSGESKFYPPSEDQIANDVIHRMLILKFPFEMNYYFKSFELSLGLQSRIPVGFKIFEEYDIPNSTYKTGVTRHTSHVNRFLLSGCTSLAIHPSEKFTFRCKYQYLLNDFMPDLSNKIRMTHILMGIEYNFSFEKIKNILGQKTDK